MIIARYFCLDPFDYHGCKQLLPYALASRSCCYTLIAYRLVKMKLDDFWECGESYELFWNLEAFIHVLTSWRTSCAWQSQILEIHSCWTSNCHTIVMGSELSEGLKLDSLSVATRTCSPFAGWSCPQNFPGLLLICLCYADGMGMCKRSWKQFNLLGWGFGPSYLPYIVDYFGKASKRVCLQHKGLMWVAHRESPFNVIHMLYAILHSVLSFVVCGSWLTGLY